MRMRNLMLSALVAGLILLLAYLLSIFYSEGGFEQWQSLGAPPHGVGEVVAVTFDQRSDAVVVLSAANDAQLQQGSLSACAASGCWQITESIPNINDWSNLTISPRCQTEFQQQAPPPGAVVWCASYDDVAFGTHFIREAHFALLNDGQVWVWQFIPGQRMILIMLGGVGLAAVGWLIAFLVLSWRRNNLPSNQYHYRVSTGNQASTRWICRSQSRHSCAPGPSS